LIVTAATQPNAFDRRLPALRHRFDMIEFEKLTRRAAPPVGADEGALTAIALPDGAAYMRGDVAAAEGSAAGTKRPGGGAELGLFGLGDEIV